MVFTVEIVYTKSSLKREGENIIPAVNQARQLQFEIFNENGGGNRHIYCLCYILRKDSTFLPDLNGTISHKKEHGSES